MKKHRESLFYSTFILTAANFIIRLMGFAYRIVLSRMAGAETMGFMQVILPFYFTFIGIVASGIPLAMSRTIARHRSRKDRQAIKMTVISSLIGTTILSIILFIIFLLGITVFSERILNYEIAKLPLLLLSPCIIIIALKAIFKGYFYGMKRVHIPASSDILEQIVRIALVFSLFYYIRPNTIEMSACIIVVGMAIGELISLLFLHINFDRIARDEKIGNIPIGSHISTIKGIGTIALPITITRVVLSLVSSVGATIVPKQLALMGMTPEQALAEFGIVGSMVMPMFFIPFTIINGLSTILIPNISEDLDSKRWDSIRNKISKAIVITSATAFFCSGILAVLGGHIGLLLFKEPKVGAFLIPSSPFLILLCLHQTLSSSMNGLGLERDGAVNNIIGGIVELISLYIFIPSQGIFGYIISFYLGSTVVIILHYIAINKKISLGLDLVKSFLKPGFAALLMASCIRLLTIKLIDIGVSTYILILVPSIAGFIIFLIVFSLLGSPLNIFPKKMK